MACPGIVSSLYLDDRYRAAIPRRLAGLPLSIVWASAQLEGMGGANHVLINIPLGPSAKVRTLAEAERLGELSRGLQSNRSAVDVGITNAHAIGRGVGPQFEALDVLAVAQSCRTGRAGMVQLGF